MTSVFHNLKTLEGPRPPTITFQLSPSHFVYANTLRRLCLTAVESVAFAADIREDGSTSDVKVLENSTPMTNEMLAHRIGLLPIMVTEPLNWDADKYEFILDVINNSDTTMDVTASDIKVFEKVGEELVLRPSNLFFQAHSVTGHTPLIAVLKPLLPGGNPEKLHFKAKATLGVGRQNARWIPTTQCAYSYSLDKHPTSPKVGYDPEHPPQKAVFEDWLQRVKKIKLEKDQDKDKLAGLIKEFETLELNRCYLKDTNGEAYSFDFTVETAGVLHPSYIIARACEGGIAMCEQFAGENLSQDVTVQPASGRITGWDFIFQRQDHTLGNCIQNWIDQNLIGKGDGGITFAGYDVIPLRDEMTFRIGCEDGSEASARRALTAAMNGCAQMFRSWREEWVTLTMKKQAAELVTQKTGKPKIIRRPLKQ